MTHRVRSTCACIAVCIAVVGAWTMRPRAFALTPFQFNIISVRSSTGADRVAPGDFATVTYSVTNPQTGAAYDLKADPAWTATASGASRLFFQIAWNTVDITNTDSRSNTVGGRGAAMPIPVNALGPSAIANGDGTYQVTAPLPVPATASGTGVVAMEGHPAGPDATGAFTVRVPLRSVHANFKITDAVAVPRRQIVGSTSACAVTGRTGPASRRSSSCTATTARKNRRCASCATTRTTRTSCSVARPIQR